MIFAMHRKIQQLDGHVEDVEDKKYAASKHCWRSGWLGGAYQSFIDANEVLEECDIPDVDKQIEKDKILED